MLGPVCQPALDIVEVGDVVELAFRFEGKEAGVDDSCSMREGREEIGDETARVHRAELGHILSIQDPDASRQIYRMDVEQNPARSQ
jgi:hypothetical protein